VQATIFDGHTVAPCTIDEAGTASSTTGLTWIDVKFDGMSDPQMTPMLTALGIDQSSANISGQADSIAFEVTKTGFAGVAWMDDQTGLPAQQLYFAWNANRLVTMRVSGDQAIAEVQQRIMYRAELMLADPSTVLGVVLQMLLVGVQQGLVRLATQVAALDEQILNTSDPNNDQAQQLAALRTSMAPLALRLPAYDINVGSALIDPQSIPAMTPGGVAQLQTFASQIDGTAQFIQTITASMRDAVQDLQAQVAGWQGNRINQLTIVTIIFLPITFLTGYFGMNFNWLDNQLNSMGSYFLWGIALPALIVMVSIVILIRKGFTFTGLFANAGKRHRGRKRAPKDSKSGATGSATHVSASD
jgi:Mg2+ and Co2+ transporter CorA